MTAANNTTVRPIPSRALIFMFPEFQSIAHPFMSFWALHSKILNSFNCQGVKFYG